MTIEEFLIGLRRRLRLQLGGDDVEHRLEMLPDAEPRQHRVDVIGRAVGQDQLAAGQLRDRCAHRGIGLERRVIDPVHIGEVVVGAHAMLGHHAAHGGAVTAVIVLLDAPRLLGVDLEPVADELADPGIDLLPQIDVMRIERVVEVEHPGVDVVKVRGDFALSHSVSCPRTRASIRRGRRE